MAQRKNKEESAVQAEEQVQAEVHDETVSQLAAQEMVEIVSEKEKTEAIGKSETEEADKIKEKPKTRKKEVVETAVESEDEDIPEQALHILGLYPKEKSLYIGNHGGVYTLDSSQSVRGNAILYKNPFYKSK
nr:MAG TPA: hypothetical protein [Caudoviricetes sp.]